MAFKTSMEFLFDLTKKSVSGNSPGLLSRIWSPQPYKDDKNQPVEQRMKAYSVAVARMLLKKEDKEELAAAALLLTALDAGYNSIMTVSILQMFRSSVERISQLT